LTTNLADKKQTGNQNDNIIKMLSFWIIISWQPAQI